MAVACTSGTVDLDVSTSVIDIPTTTTTEEVRGSTTIAPPPATTTTDDGLQPIIPDTARVVPIRPVLIADDSGDNPGTLDPSQIAEWVSRANAAFAPARIGFSYDPGEQVDVVTDTLLNGIEGPESAGWVERVRRGNAIAGRYPGELVVLLSGMRRDAEIGSHHLDFVLLGEPRSELICGDPDPLLLAHRIGLYLGLPHTFVAIHESVAEAADKLSDQQQEPSAFDGDSFEDTLPDPGVYPLSQCDDRRSMMIGGVEFDLPRDNLMSHFPERFELTLAQIDRVRWMLDLRRGNEMAIPVNEVDDHLEAEATLSATGGPCGLGAAESLVEFVGYQWVEADHLVFPASEGCRVEFTIPVPEAGTYEVLAAATRGPSHGAVEFLVDGEPFLLEDLYAPLVIATGPLSLGTTTLETGSVVIGIQVVGSNTLSSASSIAIDGFALVRSD